MGRTTVITQPTYLPWLGYFEQIARADVFIFLDTVQFVKRSWHSRNRLKGFRDKPFWLTVPVQVKSQRTPLVKVRISPDRPQWRKKNLESIRVHLGKAPYLDSLFPFIEELIETDFELLIDLNIAMIKMFSEILSLKTKFMRASDLRAEGSRNKLLLNLCKLVGTEVYYTAFGSKDYMEKEENIFEENGVEVRYQMWQHPIYQQQGKTFVSHLSVVDALMNIGPESTRALLTD